MAQSALTRSPIGVALFWEKGAQPTTTCKKMDNNNKTSHFGKREHSGRKITATKTNRRRIRLPKRTNLRTSTSRRNNSRKETEGAEKQ